MHFMNYLFGPMKKAFQYSGRASRKEFWMFVLSVWLVILGVALLFLGLLVLPQKDSLWNFCFAVFCLAFLAYLAFIMLAWLAGLALSVRRLHDIDFRGWWLLISFIPFGGLVLFAFFCIRGQKGPNRFGEDPYGYGAVCDDNLPSSIG